MGKSWLVMVSALLQGKDVSVLQTRVQIRARVPGTWGEQGMNRLRWQDVQGHGGWHSCLCLFSCPGQSATRCKDLAALAATERPGRGPSGQSPRAVCANSTDVSRFGYRAKCRCSHSARAQVPVEMPATCSPWVCKWQQGCHQDAPLPAHHRCYWDAPTLPPSVPRTCSAPCPSLAVRAVG